MKFKLLSIMFIILSMILIIPSIVLGYEDVENYEDNKITYQLFDDGTAKILTIEYDTSDNSLSINDRIWYQEEEYNVTSIAKNVFDSILTEKELYLYFEKAPILEGENTFSNITNIYILLGAEGYTKDAGWPVEKIKQYIIETQPQDIVVTPKEISDGVAVDTSASIAAGTGSIGYDWYLCDEEGNILDDLSVSNYASFKIPFDLSFDNENNIPKDYYYVCVIGKEDDYPETTRVAKVTVNPGPYKVSFNCGELAKWSIESKNGLIETYTNNDRKLDESDIPSSDMLVNNEKGVSFAGWWDVDRKKIVDPSIMTFEKNTYLSAMWKVKINFDANGGAFEDESTSFSTNLLTDISNFAFEDEVIEPRRDGYKFLGFFTAKEEGIPYEFVMDSSSFNEEITFYAQWEESNNVVDNENIEKDPEEGLGDNIENFDKDEITQESSDKEETNDDKTNQEGSDKEETNDDKTTQEGSDKKEANDDKTNHDDSNKEEHEDDKVNQESLDKEELDDDKKQENSNLEGSNDNISKNSNSKDSTTNNSQTNTVKKDEINTPQTGDDIFLYTILLVISLGGILITTILKRNTY